MKNLVLLLLIALSIVSCEDNEIHEFAMQAKIGDRLYTSTEALATISENGRVVIQGSTRLETLTLRLSRLKEGNFNIGEGFPNSAIFQDMDGRLYPTEPNGTGVVTISEVNETNKTLSGTFNFRSILPGIDTVYVSQGVLYNVSYTGVNVDDSTDAGAFSAKVDGEPFSPDMVSARETGNSIAISGSTIFAIMVITVPSTVEVGEYSLPQDGYSATYQDETGLQSTSEGTISITEHNVDSKSIKGTFSFLTDQSEITEGKFEVVYQ